MLERAGAQRGAKGRIGEHSDDRRGQLGVVVDEQATVALVDGVEMTGDPRRDHRCAAGGGFGECETEPLTLRRARGNPGALIPIDKFVIGDAPDEPQPRSGAERDRQRFEAGAMRPVADDHGFDIGHPRSHVDQRGQQIVQTLLRHHPCHREYQRSRRPFTTGCETRVDTVIRDGDLRGVGVVVLDDLVAGRERGSDQRAFSIHEWHCETLDEFADFAQRSG